jgi:phosphoribosylaminoimidazole-succinocarboxamide synthase
MNKKTSSTHLELLHQGKVRDIYKIDDDKMLMVASDRISAFDVVFAEKINGKGAVLTNIANFWFAKTKHIVPNHLTGIDANLYGDFNGEAIVVKRLKPLPIEAIVRGYIIGSGWKSYQQTGEICGINLPKGLVLAEKLPQAIYTPSSKAEMGKHDENISFKKTVDLIGEKLAKQVQTVSLALYKFASEFALKKGIIIADTKFEFGLDENDNLVLMDEVLTPDSSRFWDAKTYQKGTSPASFDKQILRDYLEILDWDKTPPAPKLPNDIIQKTEDKYLEVMGNFTLTS